MDLTTQQVALDLDAARVLAREVMAGVWDERYSLGDGEARASFAYGVLDGAIARALDALRGGR